MTEPSASVETQLALLNQKVDTLTAGVEKLSDDHESRLRVLERFQWRREGVSGGFGLLAGAAASIALKMLGS